MSFPIRGRAISKVSFQFKHAAPSVPLEYNKTDNAYSNSIRMSAAVHIKYGHLLDRSEDY